MFFCLSALHHQGSESAADDISGHAGLQQEEGDGQCPSVDQSTSCHRDCQSAAVETQAQGQIQLHSTFKNNRAKCIIKALNRNK